MKLSLNRSKSQQQKQNLAVIIFVVLILTCTRTHPQLFANNSYSWHRCSTGKGGKLPICT